MVGKWLSSLSYDTLAARTRSRDRRRARAAAVAAASTSANLQTINDEMTTEEKRPVLKLPHFTTTTLCRAYSSIATLGR